MGFQSIGQNDPHVTFCLHCLKLGEDKIYSMCGILNNLYSGITAVCIGVIFKELKKCGFEYLRLFIFSSCRQKVASSVKATRVMRMCL